MFWKRVQITICVLAAGGFVYVAAFLVYGISAVIVFVAAVVYILVGLHGWATMPPRRRKPETRPMNPPAYLTRITVEPVERMIARNQARAMERMARAARNELEENDYE